jgi:uncharacterized SAM-binding protein YcdF (DUF218 family)
MLLVDCVEMLLLGHAFVILLVFGSLLYRYGKRRNLERAFSLSFIGLLSVFVGTFLPMPTLFMLPLGPWLPENTNEKADAIVVLDAGLTPFGLPDGTSVDRIHQGVQLFLSGRAPLFLLTGSSRTGEVKGKRVSMAIARGLGIPDSKILLCGGVNTYEEAVNAKPLLEKYNAKTLLLVTSSHHIPRASAVFRHQGFTVIPYNIRSPEFKWLAVPSWRNWDNLRAVCHEYVGLLVYWFRGWI